MNCHTIDSLLDDLRAVPAAAGREDVAAHLERCPRCAAGWAAHEALSAESMGAPPPELWARVLRRAVEHRRDARAPARRRRLVMAGIAAGAALAVFGVTLLVPPERPASIATPPPTSAFVAGRQYDVLALPPPFSAMLERIPVIEFFMYGCFPCFAFEGELATWESESRDSMALTRVPAVFRPEAELHARAFYAAEALGKLEEMHAAFYDEINSRGNRLESRAALAEFFARFGVDGAAFDAAFDSREVDTAVRRAVALSAEYRVRATPTLVVGGRYSTNPSLAGSDFVAVARQLVADEAERRARAQR